MGWDGDGERVFVPLCFVLLTALFVSEGVVWRFPGTVQPNTYNLSSEDVCTAKHVSSFKVILFLRHSHGSASYFFKSTFYLAVWISQLYIPGIQAKVTCFFPYIMR